MTCKCYDEVVACWLNVSALKEPHPELLSTYCGPEFDACLTENFDKCYHAYDTGPEALCFNDFYNSAVGVSVEDYASIEKFAYNYMACKSGVQPPLVPPPPLPIEDCPEGLERCKETTLQKCFSNMWIDVYYNAPRCGGAPAEPGYVEPILTPPSPEQPIYYPSYVSPEVPTREEPRVTSLWPIAAVLIGAAILFVVLPKMPLKKMFSRMTRRKKR